MVRRALDREIERDLDPLPGSGVAEPAEILERAELRVDRVVPAFVRADRVGAARVVGQRRQRVVAPLAVDPADRMDRREIEHVEAHRADRRQARDHVGKRAVAVRIAALATREDLVPARESGRRPLGVERQRRLMAHEERSRRVAAHQRRRLGFRDQPQPLFRLGASQCSAEQGDRSVGLARCGRSQQGDRLVDFEPDGRSGRLLLGDVLEQAREDVVPSLDREDVAPDARQRESVPHSGRCRGRHRRALPFVRVGRPPQEISCELAMPVADEVGLDSRRLARNALGGEPATLDERPDRLDRDARLRRGSLGPA